MKTPACVESVDSGHAKIQPRYQAREEKERGPGNEVGENWGYSKKGKGAGRGWGSKGTLAGKPLDSEKRPPIFSRVSSIMDDNWSMALFFSASIWGSVLIRQISLFFTPSKG